MLLLILKANNNQLVIAGILRRQSSGVELNSRFYKQKVILMSYVTIYNLIILFLYSCFFYSGSACPTDMPKFRRNASVSTEMNCLGSHGSLAIPGRQKKITRSLVNLLKSLP